MQSELGRVLDLNDRCTAGSKRTTISMQVDPA
jgi:hypothetical protein